MVWQGNFSRLYIGGAWVRPASDATYSVTSPMTEEAIAEVAEVATVDVDAAVAAARSAFDDGGWPGTSLTDRIEIVGRLRRALDEERETVASLITEEMGCPITISRQTQAYVPVLIADTLAELASHYPFESCRRSASGNAVVLRPPVGVVAAIVPWNTPLSTALLKLIPALLSGSTVVLKPARERPLDGYLLAELLDSIGLPPGVVSILAADRSVSEYLVGHPGVDKVAFTGSTAAGRHIASLCGQNLKRVTLELGGKSAAVVLDDADLDAAVESLRLGSFRNSGQICSLKTRVLVSEKRQEEFLDRLAAMVSSMQVGDPRDPATEIGPLVSSRQRERVEGYIGAGSAEGARILLGGQRPGNLKRGWFVEPTVFWGVQPEMTIAREEIFGPVVSVIAYESEDQAVALANDSAYGLNGAIFTSDVEHGLALARRMRTGTVELNGSPVGFSAPIGGFKDSGIGREAGLEAFDAYTEVQSIGLPGEFVYRV